jgi:hypothetical protein
MVTRQHLEVRLVPAVPTHPTPFPHRRGRLALSRPGLDLPSWLIPDGYRQYLGSDELADNGGAAGLDIYAGDDDLTDMNTVNETGKWAGRFLYRTHEQGTDGAVSVVRPVRARQPCPRRAS